MPSRQFLILLISSLSLLPFSACGSNPSTTTTATNTAASPAAIASSTPSLTQTQSASSTDHAQHSKGGQIVEVGDYHLELLAAPENEGLHIDLYLLKGNEHMAVPDATVTAQIKLPDGTQTTVPMKYKPQEEHYTAYLNTKATGDYKVTVLTQIGSEKVNGRFGFKR